MLQRSAEFDGQNVRCRVCKVCWAASVARPYFKASTTTDGICQICLMNPDARHREDVQVRDNLL